jgi:hypothetical protein
MKRKVFRVFAVLAGAALAFSCAGRSNSYVGDEHGPTGVGGMLLAAGAGGDAGAGESDAGAGASAAGGSLSGAGGTAGGPSSGGDAGEAGDSSTPAGGSLATGGTEQGGSGGSSGAPPVTECAPIGEAQVDPYGCLVDVQCPGRVVTTSCQLNDIVWTCYCNFRPIQVRNLEGIEACEAVSELCTSDEPAWDECSFTNESRLPKSCDLARTCVKSRVNDDGVNATIESSTVVSCTDIGTGRLNCVCPDGRRYAITGVDGTGACDRLLDTCSEDSLIGFDGEAACTLDYSAGDTGFCSATATCERATDLGGGVSAIEIDETEVNCQNATSGGSTCDCSARDATSALFDIESPTDGSSTCMRYTSLCGSADIVALSSETECVPSIQNAGDQGAFVQIECGQSASFDGEQIVVYGTLWADCHPDGDKYACTCTSYEETAEVEVEASTAWDAGTAAALECPKAVKPKIGNGVISAPVPASP